ncbi:MAG: DUF5317 domain-containing protein [Clostridia bacterium]|nr:DUF5317 domain-containing protein [Clostridia bacterium]
MLVETASASILVCFFRKGKLKNLQNAYISGWYLLLIAGILQIILKLGYLETFFHPIVVLSYLLILICLVLNFRELSMVIAFIGTLMNAVVIAFNQGFMPVSSKGLEIAGYDMASITSVRLDTFHALITDSTRLAFLSDIIPIPKPYPLPQMLSIGDFFIMAGVFMFFQNAVLDKHSNKKAS